MNADLWDARLRTHFGLSMLDHPARLQDGVRAATKELGLKDENELLMRLDRGDSSAKRALARALTIGETYFFREPGPLHHFRDVLLPAAIARGILPVQVVSAACSTGEEAYSLAILAREKLGSDATSQVRILGFDLNPDSVATARRAIYRPWSLRGMSEETKQRWFDEADGGITPKPEVRAMVRFETRNMVDEAEALEPGSADVIFCRNVLIYFDDASVKAALGHLSRGLRAHGTLIVGAAEAAFFAIAALTHQAVGEMWMHERDPRPAAKPILEAAKTTPPPRRLPPPRRPRSKPASDRRPAVPPPSREPSGDAVELLDRGWKALAADPVTASEEARRAILLDRTLAAAHVLAASAALALRDVPLARRSLRNARRYLADAPPAEIVRGGGGATASELAGYCARLERALGGGQ